LDIAANIQERLRVVEAAADHGVQWLALPELSLTDYELTAMPSVVLHAEHAVLARRRKASTRTGMAITVGALVDSGSALHFISGMTQWSNEQHSVPPQVLFTWQRTTVCGAKAGRSAFTKPRHCLHRKCHRRGH